MVEEREFLVWLDGFLTAIGDKEDFTNQHWNILKDKLDEVKDKPREKQLLHS